uniref:(northern house mosquito) hypothetical protein n=1 Tax=Culex pipiens TaxID=7175 RepID=A0A8D8ND10_CULPI
MNRRYSTVNRCFADFYTFSDLVLVAECSVFNAVQHFHGPVRESVVGVGHRSVSGPKQMLILMQAVSLDTLHDAVSGGDASSCCLRKDASISRTSKRRKSFTNAKPLSDVLRSLVIRYGMRSRHRNHSGHGSTVCCRSLWRQWNRSLLWSTDDVSK